MSVSTHSVESFAAKLARHWSQLLRLAWPVMLSRIGILVMAVVDTVMLGRYDTVALAGFSLGMAMFLPIMVSGVGCMTGIVSVTARQSGAGRTEEAAAGFIQGLQWALLIGLGAVVIVWHGEWVLIAVGQAPHLSALGGEVARALSLGAMAQILFAAGAFYLEATGRAKVALGAMIAANIVNVALNWLVLAGYTPVEGAPGVALATTCARVVLGGTVVFYILTRPEIRAISLRALGRVSTWRAGREIRVIGIAGGAAFFFETVAFGALNQVAGLIGTDALAAYTVAHNVEATIFMVALGISVAAAVRVGKYIGAGDVAEARFAAWSGLALTFLVIGAIGIVMVANAGGVASVYTNDAALLGRIAPLLAILAVSLLFDGGQVVMGQCNRALGDSWGTTARFLVAFWGVMIPLGIGLGLYTPLREVGLFIATGIGCATAILLLGLRFETLVRRHAGGLA